MIDVVLKKYKQLDWQLILVLTIAAFFRFFLLDLRPAHHDEGVFGWFVDQITANGFYHYDPTNYHGPLHYYILFISQTLFGRSNWALRLPDALISLLSVYWITLFSPFLGRRTCLISATAMALSPGITYFGRYAFQEAFQVFYTIVVLWGIIGLYHEGKRKYLWSIGIGIILMILTKETYIIHVGCFVLAWLCLILWEKVSPSKEKPCAKQEWTWKDVSWIILTGLGLIIFFYSGTFFNFNGVFGLLETFQAWFKTGIKSGHNKPFIYWLILFWRYELIAVLGAVCGLRYLFQPNKWIRYIAIYGLGTFLAYSIIPYKTTWCIINSLWPFYFTFGDTINHLLKTKRQVEVQTICLLLFLVSAVTAGKINFINYANKKEPYVYVHTFTDIKKMTDPIFKLVQKEPSAYNLIGIIMRSDEWPLPWILGDFTMVGYYGSSIRPQDYNADFLLLDSKQINEVEEKLQMQYFTETFYLRDAQDISKLYLSYEKFKDIFPERQPEFTPINQGLTKQ